MEQYMSPIYPFNSTHPLPAEVESDHAPVAVKMPDSSVLMYYNISNPVHHHYFGQTPEHPFHDTHMNVPTPCDADGNLDSWLQQKVQKQLDTIVAQLKSNQVSIYVIVEGYKSFYDRLHDALPRGEFSIAIQRYSEEEEKPTQNKTAIIFNNSRYEMIHQRVITQRYQEKSADGRQCKLTVPCVQLRNKATSYQFAVAGVHVPGCASQYPETGLEQLAIILCQLCQEWQTAILSVGDYNTPPEGVSKGLITLISPSLLHVNYLTVPYDTHVNPNCKAAVYDHALWIQPLPCTLSLSHISPEGRALVHAIQRNCIPQQ